MFKSDNTIQGVFFHWYPPKKSKYGKPRLGESTLTQIGLDTPNLAQIKFLYFELVMGVPVKKNSLYINRSMLPKPAPEGRTDTLQCLKLPKCWQLISNTNIYCKMYIHQLKGSTETLQLAYIYPNCWLDICNTNNICFFMFTIYYLYSI